MPLGVMMRNPARMEEPARQVEATIVVRVLEAGLAETAPTATVLRPVGMAPATFPTANIPVPVGTRIIHFGTNSAVAEAVASVHVRTDGGAAAATKAMGAMICRAKMAEHAGQHRVRGIEK